MEVYEQEVRKYRCIGKRFDIDVAFCANFVNDVVDMRKAHPKGELTGL